MRVSWHEVVANERSISDAGPYGIFFTQLNPGSSSCFCYPQSYCRHTQSYQSTTKTVVPGTTSKLNMFRPLLPFFLLFLLIAQLLSLTLAAAVPQTAEVTEAAKPKPKSKTPLGSCAYGYTWNNWQYYAAGDNVCYNINPFAGFTKTLEIYKGCKCEIWRQGHTSSNTPTSKKLIYMQHHLLRRSSRVPGWLGGLVPRQQGGHLLEAVAERWNCVLQVLLCGVDLRGLDTTFDWPYARHILRRSMMMFGGHS